MKALWKGSISFALVNIPVRLYSAAHRRDYAFHLVHGRCSTRLRYERYCPSCGVEVPWEETAHAYEYDGGRLVTFTDEELERIPVRTSKSIEILKFVDWREIDPVYYDKPYYLEPDEGGERAYALLRATIRSSDKVGLAKITLKDREHVAVLRVSHDALALHTLYYADELTRPETLHIPGRVALDEKELVLSMELARHFLGDFDITQYHDEFREALVELIRSRAEGRKMKAAPKVEREKVFNLMDALKKSLEKAPERKAV